MRLLCAAGALVLACAVDAGSQDLTFSRDDYASYAGARAIATADFDRNGWPDVAHANLGRNTVTILLNHPDRVLARTFDVPVGAGPFDITTGDFNRDGIPDLAVANADGNSLSVLLGTGNGSFTRTDIAAPSQNPRGITTADVNKDGKPDLIYTAFASRTVQVLPGNGAGGFSKGATYVGSPANPQGLATADFNHDGHLDVALAYASSGGLRILYGNGGTSFSGRTITGGATVSLPCVGYPQAFAVADVNADGNPDIVYSSSARPDHAPFVSVFLGDGRGGFTPSPRSAPTAVSLYGMVVGDLNRDGRPDLVVVGTEWGEGTSFILPMIGRGDGTFVEGTRVYDGILYWAGALTIADLNRDAKLDFVALVDGTLRIWSGDGAGGLAPPSELMASAPAENVRFADLNADGYVDATFTEGLGVDIALGSAGGFGAPVHTSAYTLCSPTWAYGYSCWYNADRFVVGDINHDGTLDIVTAGGDVVPGNGDGTFGLAESFEYDAVEVALADFTRDGLLDILYITAEGEVGVMVNERNDRNRAPTVTAGPDRTLEYQNLTRVDGDRPCFTIPAVGEDPDLHRLWYEWRDGSGAVVSRSREFSLCATPGTYAYRVAVGDGRGGTASDSVVLTIVPTKEIVLHFAERHSSEDNAGVPGVEFQGRWSPVPDGSAASGIRAYNANLGAPKVTIPVPYPEDYVGIPFVADPTQVYKLWLRLRADNNSWANDSVWVQFSGAADLAGTPKYPLGSTSGLAVSLEECSNCGVSGWGWEDDGWGALNKNGILLRFPSGGEQYLWIQTREDGVSVDQVVLSAETYLTTRPGAAKNDHTILPATYPR